MRKNIYQLALIVTGIIVSGWAGWIGRGYVEDLNSQVITEEDARHASETWGEFIEYTPESGTETFSMTNALTAVAVIKPGMEIHPPHQHTAEEFMFVVEGNGTWSVNGEEFPAQAGDMMYAKPWDWHGITNTGDKPLKFFVVKWDGKGVDIPENPGK